MSKESASAPDKALSRLHKIINDARFEVDEILRRQRENTQDAENLERETEKLRTEHESLEKEIFYMEEQQSQVNDEHERLVRTLEDAERENKVLEEQLAAKRNALAAAKRKRDEEEEEHRTRMKAWRDKQDINRAGWETMPWMEALRKKEREVEREREKVEALKESEPALLEELEKRREWERRSRRFGSIDGFLVDFAVRMIEYRKKEDAVDQLRRRVEDEKRAVDDASRAIEAERSEVARLKKLKEAALQKKDDDSNKTQPVAAIHQRVEEIRKRPVLAKSAVASKRSGVANRPLQIDVAPDTPPKRRPDTTERARPGLGAINCAMLNTPQLNIPSFLTRGSKNTGGKSPKGKQPLLKTRMED